MCFGLPVTSASMPDLFQGRPEQMLYLRYEAFPLCPLLSEQTRDLAVPVGLQYAEREVFQLPLQVRHAEPVCQRSIYVQRFPGYIQLPLPG